MSMTIRRSMFALTAAAAGLLAALSFSTATARADDWTIGDAGDAFPSPDLVSESGMPPFDQSFLEHGLFEVTDPSGAGQVTDGQLSTTDSFGTINLDFVSDDSLNSEVPNHSVIDIWNLGGGYENVYTDLAGLGTGGANEITDTVVTPFGNFDIPTTFDAAALDFGAPAVGAAATDWAAALDADWTTLVTDFSALF
jgi:hypothetical protein